MINERMSDERMSEFPALLLSQQNTNYFSSVIGIEEDSWSGGNNLLNDFYFKFLRLNLQVIISKKAEISFNLFYMFAFQKCYTLTRVVPVPGSSVLLC